MPNLNENDKGIKFSHKGSQQSPYCARHEFYAVDLPEGATKDDALEVVYSQGYKRQNEAAWYESYARITENSALDFSGHETKVNPSYELIITYPNLD